MSPQQTKHVRQYALPGCCYEKPIIINDDQKPTPTKTTTKFTTKSKAMRFEELARGRWEGRINRPAIEAAQARSCRKRAVLEVDDDNEEPRGAGAKRRRISGGDSYLSHLAPRIIDRSPHHKDHRHLINANYENAEDTLVELEASLRSKQRQIDQERSTVREIQAAEEQTRLRDEEERARQAELQDQEYHAAVRSTLHTMWGDYDREREAADERRRNIERAQQEEARREEREAEEKRVGELGRIEANLKGMWEAYDLEEGRTPKIRPGQLSEAGQRRVRQREDMLRRRRM